MFKEVLECTSKLFWKKIRLFCWPTILSRSGIYICIYYVLREKCPNTELFLVRKYRNTGKYVPKITQYLDTFHAMMVIDLWNWDRCFGMCLTLISEIHVSPASNLFLIMYAKAFFLHPPAPAPSTCLLILKWREMNIIKTQASQYWGPYLIKYNVKRNCLLSYNSLTHFRPMPYLWINQVVDFY